ncbi:peroxisomal biogenesis factor 11-domain-containing protein [Pseudoneurospora amorphoporcata]|uniref:Peroxisomal biogenesis factor 11-domain-containing protein n=1 Tax=Pseudoneurospora amorphoporcata TaxID=241081 RepID=A0AAN6NRH5_9PEZI|nr:peroxisomal biogenesis factor 11-domain-containing protein [Pseudoneurospora amorphoporcata]
MPPAGFSHQRSQSTSSLPPSSASVGGSSLGIHTRHASTSLARGPGAHIIRPTGIPSFRGYYYYYSLSLRTGTNQDVGGLLAGPLLGGGRQQADKDAKDKEKKKKRGAQGGGQGGKGGGGGAGGGGKGPGFVRLEDRMTLNTHGTMGERGPTTGNGKRASAMGERMKVKKRSNFETLIKFGTDVSGLERTFRLFQALSQCIAYIPSTRAIFILSLSSSHLLTALSMKGTFNLSSLSLQEHLFPPPASAEAEAQIITAALGVRSKLAQGRRFFRVFRFLESFHSASTLYYQTHSDRGRDRGVETWLDIMSKSFNGMYLLFETLGFFGALGVPGLDPWGTEVNRYLHVEEQRFWFFALVCGVLGGVVKLVNDQGEDVGAAAPNGSAGSVSDMSEKGGDNDEYGNQLKEQERQRAALEQKEQRIVTREDRRMRIKRRITADLLDLAQPGAVVGWFPDWPGMIGVMMVGSTWLTGVEVWEKCAR